MDAAGDDYLTLRVGLGCKVRGNGKLHIGRNVRIGPESEIEFASPDASIDIADGVIISSFVFVGSGQGQQLRIGKRTSIQRRTTLQGSISIGTDCVLSANIFIGSRSHQYRADPTKTIREQDAEHPAQDAPIKIGNDVWIGWGVVILPGSEIGDGCIIGANVIVRGTILTGTVLYAAPSLTGKPRN